MPSPDHVDTYDKGRYGHVHGNGSEETEMAGHRRGVALEIRDQSGSHLSPSRLLSNMGISNIRDYLPAQSQSQSQGQAGPSKAVEEGYSSWQHGDLGDGYRSRPLLLLSTPRHVLQIFALSPSTLPSDPDVKERYPAPEEILSIPSLVLGSGSTRKDKSNHGNERVVEARLVDRRTSPGHAMAILLLSGLAGKGGSSTYSIALLNLSSGEMDKRVDVGSGTAASLSISSKAVVVSLSHPTPSIHFYSPTSLDPLRPSLNDLPSNSRSALPDYALSGRLLAYATSDPPRHVGKHGLGTLATSTSLASPPAHSRHPKDQSQPHSQGQQNKILNSAVGIGGGVARGVWVGLKMGAQAASRATNGRMASSAPTRSTFLEAGEDGEIESRSLDDSSVLDFDDSPSSSTMPLSPSSSRPDTNLKGGEWIRVVDLGGSGMRTIAHFRLPPSRHSVPNISTSGRRYSEIGHSSVSHLSFSPDGTTLFVSSVDGRSFHLFDIHPQPRSETRKSENGVEGEVWHLYEMRRGSTASEVVEVQWSGDGRWVGVATGRGTVHVFAINPSGGPASATTHTSSRLVNPNHLHALSTTITPSARLRMRLPLDQSQTNPRTGTTFSFHPQRSDPLRNGRSCIDIAIYRSTTQQLDLARLSVGPTLTPSRREERRGSGLTEMMKVKTRSGSGGLHTDAGVKVTWVLPSGQDLLLSTLSHQIRNRHATRNLAYAEIQSFSSNPALLPISIYLSHQVDFYDAKPIDDYSPLSILDPEARTRRLHFRAEVELRPPSSSSSLEEPLVTAIHSVIESSPSSELPYLPNEPRYGHGSYGSWKSIPIQQVRDGMGNLTRSYVRRRSPKKKEGVMGMGLSFEDDAVFANEDGQGGSESSPMSSGIPTTDVGEQEQEVEVEVDEEWGVRWEDEYRKAVEEDGGPDDLVLGLMDEQQEERRRWVEKQRGLAKVYEREGGLRK